ncbi:MAG: AI-2E family transporter [Chitinophagaceae bacterium]
MEYKNLSRLVYLAAFLFMGIWFAHQVIEVVLVIFFAIVITIVLNAPVMILQKKGMSRTLASVLVFFGMILMFALIGWMVVPKMITQVKLLVANLPTYIADLNTQILGWIAAHSESHSKITPLITQPGAEQIQGFINQVGQFSLKFFSNILMLIFFFCLVAFMLINPRPLLQLYLSLFPETRQDKAAQAFASSSTMTIGWMWSNVVAGLTRATIVWIFLHFMGIPGVWVWAGVTFFAELIPKIGFYIMAMPPILIAFAMSPTIGLWTLGFYLLLEELIADILIPRIRSKTMKIHPVWLLIMLLLMTAAFGVMGAFISTPLAAFIKGHYEVFFEKKKEKSAYDHNIDLMMSRK